MPPAVGSIDEDGVYELYTGAKPGVAPGDYVVTVTVAEVIPSAEPGLGPVPKNITPKRYQSAKTSGLKYTVEPGSNTYDLELSSS